MNAMNALGRMSMMSGNPCRSCCTRCNGRTPCNCGTCNCGNDAEPQGVPAGYMTAPPYQYGHQDYDFAHPHHFGHVMPNITINVQSGNRSSNDTTDTYTRTSTSTNRSESDPFLIDAGQEGAVQLPTGQVVPAPVRPPIIGKQGAKKRIERYLPPMKVSRKYYKEFP